MEDDKSALKFNIIPDDNKLLERTKKSQLYISDINKYDDNPKLLRVATWNLRWWPAGNPSWYFYEDMESSLARTAVKGLLSEKIEATRKMLKDQTLPEIICFQEIMHSDTFITLLTDIGYKSIIVANTLNTNIESEGISVRLDSGNEVKRIVAQDLVIASKFKINKHWYMDITSKLKYSSVNEVPPRGILLAEIEVPKLGPTMVYNIHMKSNGGSSKCNYNTGKIIEKNQSKAYYNSIKREEIAKYVLTDINKNRKNINNFIVAGDCNSSIISKNKYPFTYNYGGKRTGKELTYLTESKKYSTSLGKNFYPVTGKLLGSTEKFCTGGSDTIDHIFILSRENDVFSVPKDIKVIVKKSLKLTGAAANSLSSELKNNIFRGHENYWIRKWSQRVISDHNLVIAKIKTF